MQSPRPRTEFRVVLMAKEIQIMGGPLDGAKYKVPDGASQVRVTASDGAVIIMPLCDKDHAHWDPGQ